MSDQTQTTDLDKLASELRQAAFPGARSWYAADTSVKAAWLRVAQHAAARVDRAVDKTTEDCDCPPKWEDKCPADADCARRHVATDRRPLVLVVTPEEFEAIEKLLHISDMPSPITLKRVSIDGSLTMTDASPPPST
jgi:hypothetical protein